MHGSTSVSIGNCLGKTNIVDASIQKAGGYHCRQGDGRRNRRSPLSRFPPVVDEGHQLPRHQL